VLFPCIYVLQLQLIFLLFSTHLIRWHMTLICLVDDDIYFDHLINVVFDRLLHYEVILFCLVMKVFESIWTKAYVFYLYISVVKEK
jgi:hypothetical protein